MGRRAKVRAPLTEAQRELVAANVGIAYAAADSVYAEGKYLGDRDELRQAAAYHLVQMIVNYDPTRASLSTYVFDALRSRLRYLVQTHGFGGQMRGCRTRGGKERVGFGSVRRKRTTTPQQLARMNAAFTMLPRKPISLDEFVYPERPEDGTLAATIPDATEPPALDPDQREALAAALSRLTPVRAWLVRRYYLDEPPATARELAQELGVSHQSILYRLQVCIRHLANDVSLQRACGHA